MNDNYTAASGETIYAGMFDPNPPYSGDELGAVSIFSEDTGVPNTTENQTFLLSLHASGGATLTGGRQYRAEVADNLAYDIYDEWPFSTLRGVASMGNNVLILRPTDQCGLYPSSVKREGFWMGYTGMGSTEFRLFSESRVDALVRWAELNLPIHPTKRYIAGGSMGGWGTLTYGIRRSNKFAAIYPDRPRWRYSKYDEQKVTIPNWPTGNVDYTLATSPNIRTEDGGGLLINRLNIIDYVSDTNNKIPWVGWCVGVADGFTDFRDHQDAVVAMRAAGRAFAFAWNGGNHSTGSIPSQIINSYPYGTFEIGKGYPLFTNHSADDDIAIVPTVGDLTVKGINLGLSFRNVVETSTGWSCEVTSIFGARAVDVKPISDIFTAVVSAQTITIPAANTWVPVTFSV